jgi:hypothetical protein
MNMIVTERQAFMQALIERARAADSPIDGDADFMMLVQMWIDGEIDVAEMRSRYRQVRDRRLEERRTAHFVAFFLPSGEALPSADDLLDEFGRMSHSAGY